MLDFIDKKISVGNIIEIIVIIVSVSIFIVMIKADVRQVKSDIDDIETDQSALREYHNKTIPNIYLRQDVAAEQFKAIRAQLDRIERKINE